MFDNGNDGQSSSDIEPRTRRALSECMSVLRPDFQPITDDSLTVVTVTTGSGSTYTVDVREERCTCPDQKHRSPDGGCKHVRRASIALGRTPVPAGVFGSVNIADDFGANVDATAKVATADGGVIETGDDAEILRSNASPRWIGPHTEYNQNGEPTGAHYLECSSCGVQVLSGRQETAYHTPECDSRSGE